MSCPNTAQAGGRVRSWDPGFVRQLTSLCVQKRVRSSLPGTWFCHRLAARLPADDFPSLQLVASSPIERKLSGLCACKVRGCSQGLEPGEVAASFLRSPEADTCFPPSCHCLVQGRLSGLRVQTTPSQSPRPEPLRNAKANHRSLNFQHILHFPTQKCHQPPLLSESEQGPLLDVRST